MMGHKQVSLILGARMSKFKRLVSSCALSAIAFAVIAPVAVVAQETTADIRGQIKGAGSSLNGASVVVTHVASGTRASARTDASGQFVISGLRSGGPYNVSVSASNFQTGSISDVYLSVSEPFIMSVDLEPLNRVVVTGTRVGGVRTDGSNTALRRDAIEARVVIDRDLRELARSSPLVSSYGMETGGVMIAGSNPRTNRITIDGVQAQDDFGLNSGGFPTRRGPVSVDAISQFNITATPFDVRNGGFLGGAMDIVLRSGDNNFHGSAFDNFKSADLTSARIERYRPDGSLVTPVRVQPIVDQTNWGATLRGPILKDRLFFALAYETFESSDITSRGPANSGFANTVVGPTGAPMTQAEIDAVTNVYGNTYHGTRDLGSVPLTMPITDEKYSVRLDWNISDKHRANFTYRKASSEVYSFTNLSTSTVAGISSIPTMSLNSQWYMTGENDETMSAQINSNWNDRFSTELRVSHRDYTRLQEPPGGQTFSDVSVCSTPTSEDLTSAQRNLSCQSSTGSNRGVVRFGPDQFRHANYLTNINDQVHFEARYRMGQHNFKAGVQYQNRDIYNLFVSNSDGTYYFDSIADFTAGRANQLIYTNAPSGNPNDAAAAFEYNITSLYAQDNWQLLDNFRLNFGLRYESYGMDKKPVSNANFLARRGFANTETYDGLDIVMPRISFNWDPMQGLKVSGGIGLFSGGLPDVFMSNSFSNTGIATVGVTIQRKADGTFEETGNAPGFTQTIGAIALNNLVGANFGTQIPAEVLGLLGGVTPSTTSEVNALDPNFEVPSEWKANISVTKDLPWGLKGAFDGVYTQVKTGYAFRDARAVPLIVNGQQALTPDGRIRYDALSTAQRTAGSGAGKVVSSTGAVGGSNRDIVLYNPDGDLGHALTAAVSLSKRWNWGLNANISYTFQEIEELSSSGRFSSTASSLYGGQYGALDPNAPAYGRGQEEIHGTIKYSLDWKGTPVGDLETRVSLFGEKRSGRPFSFVMNTGSGRSVVTGVNKGNQLAYVPNLAGGTVTDNGLTGSNAVVSISTDSKVVFDSVTTLNNLRGVVDYFGLPQGSIAERSGNTNDDVHLVDLKISQDIPSVFHGHKAQISFEIANVLNLLNDEWGVVEQFNEQQTLYTVSCAGANGLANDLGAVTCEKYRISNASSILTAAETLNLDRSRWQITIGLRYEF